MVEQATGNFSNWLSEVRTGERVSRKNLAAEASVDRSTLSRLEAGNRHPTIKVANKIAQALGTESPLPMDLPFGVWLRERREILDISMRELGRRAGVSHTFILRIESGQRKPLLETAQRLLAALT
jgi:transcriptional regulator with XRE-family HTH domain